MSRNVTVVEKILSANDKLAEQNRARIEEAGVYAVNIMASPGAGKTSVILKTIEALKPKLRIGVVEGDTAPVTIDADKVAGLGMPAVQINTGGECHLDAIMLQGALNSLPLNEIEIMIIENVGNLICPASFQLGAHISVLIASVPEGDDKPYKYPGMYRGVDAVILNKTDLLPYVKFDMEYFRKGVEVLNPGLAFFPLSCATGEGFDKWVEWLTEKAESRNR